MIAGGKFTSVEVYDLSVFLSTGNEKFVDFFLHKYGLDIPLLHYPDFLL